MERKQRNEEVLELRVLVKDLIEKLEMKEEYIKKIMDAIGAGNCKKK